MYLFLKCHEYNQTNFWSAKCSPNSSSLKIRITNKIFYCNLISTEYCSRNAPKSHKRFQFVFPGGGLTSPDPRLVPRPTTQFAGAISSYATGRQLTFLAVDQAG